MTEAAVRYEFQLIDHITEPLKNIQAALRQTEQAMQGAKDGLKSLGIDTKEASS
jgi:hypothetical protein